MNQLCKSFRAMYLAHLRGGLSFEQARWLRQALCQLVEAARIDKTQLLLRLRDDRLHICLEFGVIQGRINIT